MTEVAQTERQQMAHALERFLKGPDAKVVAAEIAGIVWNMVCMAVEQQKPQDQR